MMELSKSNIEHLIDEWVVGRNADRNKKIAKRKLIDGVTFKDLADEFQLSERQLSIIIKKIDKAAEVKTMQSLYKE